MEKKKLQRIIGISVIVAFVIVLIPFLFGKREVPQQELNTAATTEEPASPNAATNDGSQASLSENNATNTADPNNPGVQNPSAPGAEDNGITPITPTAPPVAANTQTQGTTPGTANPSADMNNNQAPAPSTQMNTPAPTMNNTTSSTTTMNNAVNPAANPPSAVTPATTSPTAAPVSAENTAPTEDTMQVAPAVTTDTADTTHPQATAEPAAAVTAPSQPVKPHHAHKSLIVKKTSHLSERVVSELKKPAWVVQMGSFKEKSNAHRLVNQLRNSGFKAFTHVVTSPNGAVRTRVYIGPEFKQASALKLSNKVEQEVKLRGYVIPYKPMAL